MAEPARALDYEKYNHGTAAPAKEAFPEEEHRPLESPRAEERARQREKAKAAEALQNMPSVSFFAIAGTVIVSTLMIFVVLAQISYNETAVETARLRSQYVALNEQHRRLEVTFESVIDMAEIERYARDVLGMSRPGVNQTGVIQSVSVDRAEVLAAPPTNVLRDIGAFFSSLLEHFR
ncbi:MAG: cell division protein FtsL [Oscillospiraceae bacterium]|nr:cell division protein FtsL [Oscillospiraceae bacterium]